MMKHPRLLTATLACLLATGWVTSQKAVPRSHVIQQLVKFGGEVMILPETLAHQMMRRSSQNLELLREVAGVGRSLMMRQYRGGAEFRGTDYLPLEVVDQTVSQALWRLTGPDLTKLVIQADGVPQLIQGPLPLVVARGQEAKLPLVIRNQMEQQASLIFARWPGLSGMEGARQEIGIPRDSTRGYLLTVTSDQAGRWEGPLELLIGDRLLKVPLDLEVREVGRLNVRLLDHEGNPTVARCYLRASDGMVYAPEGSWERITETSGEYYFYADGSFTLELPVGTAVLEVVKGLQYQPQKKEIEIGARTTRELDVQLPLGVDMASRGWYSGDAHFHANSNGYPSAGPEDVLLHVSGENLNVSFPMLSNSIGSWVLDEDLFTGKPDRISTEKHIVYWAEEIRSAKLYGHMGLLNLKEFIGPLYTGWEGSRYPYDYPPHHFHAVEAHRQGGLVTYVHPGETDPSSLDGARAHELPVDIALGQVDAVDVFSQHPERPSMELWYRLLNCGFQCPISAGTDSNLNGTVAPIPGGSRVFVKTGVDFSYDRWIKGFKEGRTFATNGPMLEFSVGGKGPSEELRLSASSRATVEVQFEATSVIAPMEKLEIVVNGKVMESIPVGGDGKHLKGSRQIQLEGSSWIAVRATGPPHRLVVTDDEVLAHTSPVYCLLAEQPISSPEDASFFMNWIDDLIAKVNQHGVFAKLDHKYEVIRLFRKAQAIYSEQAGTQ